MLIESNLFISIPIAGWQETFRSPASRLAGDFSASASRLAGDQKVSCQPAGRRPRLYLNSSFQKVQVICSCQKVHVQIHIWLNFSTVQAVPYRVEFFTTFLSFQMI